MASSTTSRLLSLGKNNKTLQILIHRHLLRPTAAAAAAATQLVLLNPTTAKSPNIAEMLEKEEKSPVSKNIGGFSPFGMMGFSGVDPSGSLHAGADSDGSFGFVSETDMEDSDGDFGFDFDYDDSENVDMSEDSEEDTDTEDDSLSLKAD